MRTLRVWIIPAVVVAIGIFIGFALPLEPDDGFTKGDRELIRAMGIEQCMETPNCHLHASDLIWLIGYDTRKSSP
jgi:hypothetical protein